MNIYQSMGLFYVLDIALSTFCIGIFIILCIYKFISTKKKNLAILGISICIFLISLFYFITNYYYLILNRIIDNPFTRIFDIWLSIFLNFCILSFIRYTYFNDQIKKIWNFICIVYAIIFIESFINYGFILTTNYTVNNPAMEPISSALQSIQTIILFVFCILFLFGLLFNKYTIKKDPALRVIGIFILIIGILFGTQNAYYGFIYISNIENSRQFMFINYDFSAFFYLILSILILLYLIIFCFINIYNKNYVKGDAYKKQITENEALDIIAKNFNLTPRENEVIIMIYNGYTYQRVADELYISKNTVKHHVANIYKKTNLSSKMDLINEVRDIQQNYKPK